MNAWVWLFVFSFLASFATSSTTMLSHLL
jgi:hypothetical protein